MVRPLWGGASVLVLLLVAATVGCDDTTASDRVTEATRPTTTTDTPSTIEPSLETTTTGPSTTSSSTTTSTTTSSTTTSSTTTSTSSTTTTTRPATTTTVAAGPKSVPPDAFLVGAVEASAGHDFASIDAFTDAVGWRPNLVSIFTSFAQPFPAATVSAIRGRGALAMVTLEPWPRTPGVTCDTDVASCIVAGAFDAVATAWATDAAASGESLLLRFAHEPNLDHYPWGLHVSAAADYVAAWRHMHELFQRVGATNVEWVWAYQAPGGPNPVPDEWWPGADVVDWIGIDGYNAGTALSWGGWLSFRGIFNAGLQAAQRIAPELPVMISETASSTEGGSRPVWIDGLAQTLETNAAVRGVVWFEIDKEADWSVADDPASAAALGRAFDRLTTRT